MATFEIRGGGIGTVIVAVGFLMVGTMLTTSIDEFMELDVPPSAS
jgi:hypothetical protein